MDERIDERSHSQCILIQNQLTESNQLKLVYLSTFKHKRHGSCRRICITLKVWNQTIDTVGKFSIAHYRNSIRCMLLAFCEWQINIISRNRLLRNLCNKSGLNCQNWTSGLGWNLICIMSGRTLIIFYSSTEATSILFLYGILVYASSKYNSWED